MHVMVPVTRVGYNAAITLLVCVKDRKGYFICNTALAKAMLCSSPVYFMGSSESFTTGVHGSLSGKASVIFITMFMGFNPTSLVKLVPIPNDIPILSLQ